MFKKAVLFTVFFGFVIVLNAGNNPCSASPKNSNMLVFETVSIGVSPSGVDEPACGMYYGADEWFSFTAPTQGDVAIQLLEGSITNAAFALYSGSCNDLQEIQCVNDYLCGSEQMPAWFFENLTPGATYYLRIWNEDGPFPGTVQLRIANPSGNPYVTTGSATNISFQGYSNCIQLTAAVPFQAGCAWYPVQVDFSQPFEHQFNLYFGTIQGQAGADGMAIIYHINNIPICGNPGSGVGYEGIPNSWAIEFDTYQNGPPYIDPVQDHTAISINGNLFFHPSGPVTLGYISDGEFHDVVVSWQPSTQLFRVWFDGILVHDLNYDIVNQVFGGQTMVWWGVSASTGGAINQHVLCFDDIEIENLANVYTNVDLTVCEDETVFLAGERQTEPGIYIDYFTAFNGCDSIVTTNLMHFPASDPANLQEVICPGQTYFFHGIPVLESGTYEAILMDQYGCDSLVILEATVPVIDVYLEENGPITCDQETVKIEAFIETNADEIIIDWVSFGGNIISGNGTQIIEVNQAGVYVAEIFLIKNGVLCGPYPAEIQVNEFFIYPFGEIEITGTLGCNDETVILDGSNVQNVDEYIWTSSGGGNIINQINPWTIEVNSAGIYELEAINLFSGCSTKFILQVDPPPGAPASGIAILDTASCGSPVYFLSAEGSSTEAHIIYHWTVEGGEITGDSNGFELEFINGSLVFLTVIDTISNCRSTSSVFLPFNDNFPDFMIELSGEINCLTNEVEVTVIVKGEIETDLFFLWKEGDELIETDTGTTTMVAINPGWYYLEVSEITGRCTFADSIEIFSNYDRAEILLNHPGDIDCLTDSLLLEAILSLPDSILDFHWRGPDGAYTIQQTGSAISILEPGNFILDVVHQISGCISSDSIFIGDSRELPQWWMPDTITLNCREQAIEIDPLLISPQSDSSLIFLWFEAGQDEPFSLEKSQVFTQAGNFYLLIKNENNHCEAFQYLRVIMDNIAPEIELTGPEILNCETFEATIEVIEFSGLHSVDYRWYDSDWNELQTGSTKNLPISSGGWYYVLAENPDNFCASIDSVLLVEDFTVPSGRLVMEPDRINCVNPEAIIKFEPDFSNDSLILLWNLPDGSVENQLNPPYATAITQGGWIELEVIHPVSRCIFEDSLELFAFFNQPIIELDLSGELLNCEINEIQAVFEISGEHENLVVVLSDPEGNQTTFFSGLVELTAAVPGLFQLSAIDTLSLCEDRIEFEIGFNRDYPQVNLLPFEHLSCSNPQVTLQIGGDFDETSTLIKWFASGEFLGSEKFIQTNEPGIYTVMVTNPENGCITLTDLELLYLGDPFSSIELSIREVDCDGKNGAIFIEKINGGTPPFQWYVNNQLAGNAGTIQPLGWGQYELLWVDSLGCTWLESVTLHEPEPLQLSIPPSYIINEGESVELKPTLNKAESEILAIVWEPDLFLDCSHCLIPVSQPPYSLEYQLWIRDMTGCEQLVTTKVEVKIKRDVYIPNAFSPGKRDGINDFFFPFSREGRIAQIYSFEVFDRWGEKVFSARNLPPDNPENGWDGTFFGEDLNPGVFIYILKIEWIDGVLTTHRGDISLLR